MGEEHVARYYVFKEMGRDFPGGPVVETLPSKTECVGSIPDWGTKIPHASWPTN